MNRNLVIVAGLVALAVVPVTLTFCLSGDGDEAKSRRSRSSARMLMGRGGDRGRPGSDLGGTEEDDDGLGGMYYPDEDGGTTVPVFKGFEHPRYQRHDRLIARYVSEFNSGSAAWAGATTNQADRIPKITAAQVKAHMIQETGGGDVGSRAAWDRDPLQVNVPGDWNPYKKYLGLREPRRRNEGSVERNLKAGIMLLSRKGFGVAGQPAANRPAGSFDGWKPALQRYNGRSDKVADGRPYREAYAERILDRAETPGKETPIQIKK